MTDRCPGSGQPPRMTAPNGSMGECPSCHDWRGVYPVKGTIHAHKRKHVRQLSEAERNVIFDCQECGMWVLPTDRHTIEDCEAFVEQQADGGNEP